MEVSEYLQNAEDNMTLAVEYLDETLSHIRARRTHHSHNPLGEGHVQRD